MNDPRYRKELAERLKPKQIFPLRPLCAHFEAKHHQFATRRPSGWRKEGTRKFKTAFGRYEGHKTGLTCFMIKETT